MKGISLTLSILISLFIFSCSDDDDLNIINTEKKITQIKYQYSQNQYLYNVSYDSNNNISETFNSLGQTIQKYTYDSSNKLVYKEFNEYNNDVLINKDISNFSFNSDNKISTIEETYIYYNPDGSVSNQSSVNHNVTYGSNSITRISDDFSSTKAEYSLTNNLITGIKIYRNNILKNDMTFEYDSEGNCISGNGPIDEGSLDSTTNDINLSVAYGTSVKNEFFNKFFDYEILTQSSFYNLRQVLINQQGTKYPEEIQWYQFNNSIYKETYNNSFDSDGYITNQILSEFPDYPNYGSIDYTWE